MQRHAAFSTMVTLITLRIRRTVGFRRHEECSVTFNYYVAYASAICHLRCSNASHRRGADEATRL